MLHLLLSPNKLLTLIGCSVAALAVCSASAQDLPSQEEMWRIIQQQQRQIEQLTERLNASEAKAQATDSRVEEARRQVQETQRQVRATDEKVEATTAYVEQSAQGAAARGQGWFERTQLGGYGELHYNMGRKDQIDFHRWVLFVSHDFSDRLRFFSEVELEHSLAGEGKKGEVELEQAFVEYDLTDSTRARGGLFLIPVGLLNQTHEPATFYGVERNGVESQIIPTTWWEGGAAFSHEAANGLSFDVAAHSGLFVPTSGGSAFSIRSGRQKVSEARAKDGALTGRIRYTGLAGLELGLTAQVQQDLAQRTLPEKIDATLVSAHADWRHRGFGLRALYARWDLDGAAPAAIGADEQYGYYLEPSYRFATTAGDVGFFARYSVIDTKAGDAADSKDAFYDVGVNFWPHPNVVLKGDVQFTDFADPAKDDEIVNLGIGYQF